MRFPRLTSLLFIALLSLAALACGLPFDNPLEEKPPAVETAEEAARLAGEAAQTAAAQAGELAGTAVAVATTEASQFFGTAAVVVTTEGSQALGTAQALAEPHVDYLKEKVASVQPDEEGNVRVELTEQEVTAVLRLRQLVMGDVLGASIKSQQAEFQDGTITFSGTIIEPLPGQIVLTIRPSVVDGVLQLAPEEASLGGQQAPPQALAAAEAAINDTLGEAFEFLPEGVFLDGVTAEDGLLVITGHQGLDEAE